MRPEYYPDFDQRKRFVVKIGIITAVIITLVIISYVIFNLIFRAGKVGVEVIYAPFYAKVELDGKKLKNNAKHYLKPGEYEIKVSAVEFEEYSTKVKVDENTEYIYGALNPATAKGEELISGELQDEFLEIEGIAGGLITKEIKRIDVEYPILKKLPYENSLYTLGYLINSGEKDYTLTVSTSVSALLNNAVEKLKEFSQEGDKSLAEYRIDFTVKNEELNPFKSFRDNSSSDPGSFLRTGFSDIGDFMVRSGKISDNYYYTIISVNATTYNIGTTYRVVLVKNDGKWRLAGTPAPIVTTDNTPGVPLEVLNELNNTDPPKPEIAPNRNNGV